MKVDIDLAIDAPKLVSNTKRTGAYLNEAMQDTFAYHPHADETHMRGYLTHWDSPLGKQCVNTINLGAVSQRKLCSQYLGYDAYRKCDRVCQRYASTRILCMMLKEVDVILVVAREVANEILSN